MQKKVQFSLYITCILGCIWIFGFCLFSVYAISLRYSADEPTDGIVVLTGGAHRIDEGVRQLREKDMNHLLISGVNKSVSVRDVLKKVPPQLFPKITLGYYATNTHQNAVEVAEWARQNHFNSILLVTSFYHMPRSQFELESLSPELKIVPLPVFPHQFGQSVEWVKTKYAWFLFVEYHKFLVVYLQSFLKGVFL